MDNSVFNSQTILKSIDDILENKESKDSTLGKICKLLQTEVYHYDWVGFYELSEPETLVLGPYVGKPTDHTHIPVGKGVCGQVAAHSETMVVQDVSKMDNYIACSIDVQSEIVVPIVKDGKFIAEIDIDSHASAPFTDKDQKLLESIAEKIKNIF